VLSDYINSQLLPPLVKEVGASSNADAGFEEELFIDLTKSCVFELFEETVTSEFISHYIFRQILDKNTKALAN